MAITIEEMKERLVENEIEYIQDLLDKNNHDELLEYVMFNCFSNFTMKTDQDIKEMYKWWFEEEKSND